MKKQKNKQGIKASKLAKAENKLKKQAEQIITVKNAEGDPDTQAKILIQNKINYTPKVSVIIPVYNVEAYLRECLDSVINQTLKEIEIICVDDGSTDSSLEILKEYAKKDNRISVLTQENLHAGVARNAGLAVAKGEYLSFLDSDDFFELDMLKETYNKVKSDSTDVCIFSAIMLDYKENEKKEMPWLCKSKKEIINMKDIKDKIFDITSPNCWNKIFKKDIINCYNLRFQSLINANDVYFSYMAVVVSKKISILNKKFINYRYNTGKQITSGLSQNSALNIYYALAKLKKQILELKGDEFLSKTFYNMCVCALTYQRKQNVQSFEKEIETFEKLFFPHYINMYRKSFKLIPIVFATNNSYAPYANATIISILENSNSSFFYQFYIFYSCLDQEKIQKEYQKYKNFDIKFINVNEYIKNHKLYPKAHYSEEMYYRMLIPEILNQYKKVLYLDCDLIVKRDISQLYNEELNDNYLGAVRNYCNIGMSEYLRELNIDPLNYFNSGVIIFNNEKWIEHKLRQKCFELISKMPNLACPDQDVLNIVCMNKIKFLDNRWNFMWQHLFAQQMHWTPLLPELQSAYEKQEKDFFIIHYTSNIKPWNNPHNKYSEEWWKYAKLTDYFGNYKRNKLLKSYLFYPQNLIKKYYLQRKKNNYQLEKLNNLFRTVNIDCFLKNTVKNEIIIKETQKLKFVNPQWMKNKGGNGYFIHGSDKNSYFILKSMKEGVLCFLFRGVLIVDSGQHFPHWIDYKSIKIDGKEILSAPIATWHDKPFRYEMPVKDGQVVKVEVVQQYHQYSKDELKDVILKLNPNSDYIKENIEKLTNKIYKIIAKEAPLKSLLQRAFSIYSCKHKNISVMDLIQRNQTKMLQILQEIQAKNVNLENKNNELKKEIEILKGAFNTQLSDFKKQQDERSKQLKANGDLLSVELQYVTAELQRAEQSQASEIKAILSKFTAQLAVAENKLSAELQRATSELQSTEQSQTSEIKASLSDFIDQLAATENKLSAELQRATEELQNSSISEISEIKTYCADFAQYLDNAQAKMLSELNNQRETALQNKNNIIAGINQTEQSLQMQASKSHELVQEQMAILDRVQERLEDLSALKEIDFAQKSELDILSQDIEKQKSELLEKVQNLQNKAQLQYQELNFADLLHDSTQNSPWLKDKNFALYGWAANYSFIYTLFRILDNVQPAHILEMGLGQTSIVTSQYIANNKPEADLDIIENDESWIKIYEPKLAKSQNIKLHQCDIEFFDYEGEQSRKYKELDKITGDKKYNLIIVDGPLGGAQKFPRSNIVELVEHNLAQDFIIMFDDAERAGEQNTIAQTKAKLASQGIEFGFQQRNALKSQVLIFSKSCEFAKYL